MPKKNPSHAELHVLIVDDDRDDLTMLGDAFRTLSEGRWRIHAALGVAEALHAIKSGKIQLVVLAVNSAALDVSLLLGSFSEHHAEFKTVVVAATATAENRVTSLAGGADLFFEKPVSPEGLRAVFVSVSELVGWALPPDFQTASNNGVGLGDLIQMECLARNSSVLELFREQSLGRIYLEEGRIIHAVCGEISGERAFQKLLACTGANFELHDFEPPPERTINRTWDYLLGEATRLREASAARTGAGAEISVADETAAHQPAGTVAELLICSAGGEVLYQWQCADAATRLALLREIAQRAEALVPHLQLGKTDRLEIQLAGGRAILQPRGDRMIFVRVTNPEEKHEG